jgi:hypothetical protein
MRSLLNNETKNQLTDGSAVRCRARREIRTHKGNVRPAALGTIISEIDNLGRHLLEVRWGNGVCSYVFPHEVEIIGDPGCVERAA